MALPNRSFRTHGDDSVNLMPFINFLVVLVPVLMLSAEFQAVNILSAKLPDAGVRTDSPSLMKPAARSIVICVSDSSLILAADDRILWSRNFPKEMFPGAALDTSLRVFRSRTDPGVDRIIVASDAKVKYQTVIDVMDFARKNGFSEISVTRWRG